MTPRLGPDNGSTPFRGQNYDCATPRDRNDGNILTTAHLWIIILQSCDVLVRKCRPFVSMDMIKEVSLVILLFELRALPPEMDDQVDERTFGCN
jgi:hypothetical protein